MRETPCPRAATVVGLACLLLIAMSPRGWAAQIEATPVKTEEEALKGVKALRILVPDMGAMEIAHGATKEMIEEHARKILKEKLPALKLDPKAITVLYLTVNLADFQSRLGYYGNLVVELRRPTMIMVGKDFPDASVQEYKVTLATVWAQSIIFTGEVLAPTAVRKALDGVLGRLIADFRKANP